MKQSLVDSCHQQLRQFCHTIDALDLRFQESKKQAQWQIFTSASQVEVVYEKKGSLLHAPSLLYARIYPLKGEALFLHPHEMRCIADLPLGCSDFYPYIESNDRMTACVKALTKSIQALLPLAQAWAEDPDRYEAARLVKHAEIFRILNVQESDLPSDTDTRANTYYPWIYHFFEQNVLMPRLAGMESPYLQLASGREEKARKMYQKWETSQKLTGYEAALWQQLQTGIGSCSSFPADCNTPGDIMPFTTSKAADRYFLLSGLVCWAAFSVLYLGVTHCVEAVMSSGALFFPGVPWYFPVIMAGPAGIFGGMALRRFLIPLLYPKKKALAMAADRMQSSKSITILATILFTVSLLFSATLVVVMPLGSAAFYQDHFTCQPDDVAFFPTTPRTIPYHSVTAIYKIEGRHNAYGDLIPRASYVLRLYDGSYIDLDGHASLADSEAHILPLVTSYGGEPILLDSDRDLPQ